MRVSRAAAGGPHLGVSSYTPFFEGYTSFFGVVAKIWPGRAGARSAPLFVRVGGGAGDVAVYCEFVLFGAGFVGRLHCFVGCRVACEVRFFHAFIFSRKLVSGLAAWWPAGLLAYSAGACIASACSPT
jgi:hypothetical protein